MKKIYYLLLLSSILFACAGNSESANIPDEVVDPEEKEEEKKEEEIIPYVPKNAEDMTKFESDTVAKQLYKIWLKEQKAKTVANLTASKLTAANTTMKFATRIFGDTPSDGRSLWISLHGGGGTTEGINNQQWGNQQSLYSLTEGIYVCPRAPWDAWNMWFKAEIDPLFEELIKTMVANYEVNPNKVFVMGYSAGGDGVWRLAPRMADHWAAAAMMAGHPGDISLLNVRNMPFTLWVGGNDTDYNRNVEVAKRGQILDSLQRDDPDGYIHETNVLTGYPHWMDGKDRAAVTWMEKFVRNPHPDVIVWRQEGVTRTSFYWLSVPKEELAQGMTIRAHYKENKVFITECDYSKVTVYLADDMVDLDKEVTIVKPNGQMQTVKPKRSTNTLTTTLNERCDQGYMFPVAVEVEELQ